MVSIIVLLIVLLRPSSCLIKYQNSLKKPAVEIPLDRLLQRWELKKLNLRGVSLEDATEDELAGLPTKLINNLDFQQIWNYLRPGKNKYPIVRMANPMAQKIIAHKTRKATSLFGVPMDPSLYPEIIKEELDPWSVLSKYKVSRIEEVERILDTSPGSRYLKGVDILVDQPLQLSCKVVRNAVDIYSPLPERLDLFVDSGVDKCFVRIKAESLEPTIDNPVCKKETSEFWGSIREAFQQVADFAFDFITGKRKVSRSKSLIKVSQSIMVIENRSLMRLGQLGLMFMGGSKVPMVYRGKRELKL